MFDQIGNLPLHPLAVHAVVVGAPLAALLGVLFAIPRTRDWARWPVALVGVGAFAASLVAKESGEALRATFGPDFSSSEAGALIRQHSMLADQLVVMLAAYAVLAVLNALVVTRASRAGVVRAVDRVLPAMLVIGAALVVVWTFRVGDLGARAVWNPTDAPL